MTYAEKLKIYNETAKKKIALYKAKSLEIKTLLKDGHNVTLNQLAEQEKLFAEYHKSIGLYKELVSYLIKNKIRFTEPFQTPDSVK